MPDRTCQAVPAPCKPHWRRSWTTSGTLIALAMLASALTSAPAGAEIADEDSSAVEPLEKLISMRSRDALSGLASPIDHTAAADNVDTRPQLRGALLPAAWHGRRVSTGTRLASLGGGDLPPMSLLPEISGSNARGLAANKVEPERSPGGTLPSLAGGEIRWMASPDCLAAPLRAVLAEVAANFGPLRVNSTCRSKSHNRRVGGARRSYHLTGSAVDFRVPGRIKEIHAFLAAKRVVGGLKHYGFGAFHIDTGPRRTWANKPRRSRRG